MIQSTSDELLRACNIKAGQIFLIRKALCEIPKSNEDADTVTMPYVADTVTTDTVTMPYVADTFTTDTVTMPYVADTVTTGVVLEATDISGMPVTLSVVEGTPAANNLSDAATPVFRIEAPTSDDKWLTSFQLPARVIEYLPSMHVLLSHSIQLILL